MPRKQQYEFTEIRYEGDLLMGYPVWAWDMWLEQKIELAKILGDGWG